MRKHMTEGYYEQHQKLLQWEQNQPEYKAVQDVLRRIREVRPLLERLSEQLAPQFREGIYSAIISDDKSGRLPAVFLGKIAGHLSRDAGAKAPTRIFVTGGHHLDVPEHRNQLHNYIRDLRAKGKVADRALVVTEYMSTGIGIENIMRLFEKEGVACDVAALSADKPLDASNRGNEWESETSRRVRTTISGHELSPQEVLETGPLAHQPFLFLGEQHGQGTGFSFYLTKEPTGVWGREDKPYSVRNLAARPEVVKASYRAINKLADEVYEKYFAQQDDTAKAA